jgi:hypothetical protein
LIIAAAAAFSSASFRSTSAIAASISYLISQSCLKATHQPEPLLPFRKLPVDLLLFIMLLQCYTAQHPLHIFLVLGQPRIFHPLNFSPRILSYLP